MKYALLSRLVFCFSIATVSIAARAQDRIDDSFGAQGLVLTPRSLDQGTGSAPPGAMVVTASRGYWWAMADEGGGILIARLTHAGAFAPDFHGGNGPARITTCVTGGALAALADADEALLLWTGRCVLRLRADGSLDTKFGAQGVRELIELSTARMARDANGRIVIAGSGGDQWRAWRLLGDGVLDTSFAAQGAFALTPPSSNGLAVAQALAVRVDGSIAIGGWRGATWGPRALIVGLTAQGALDPAFGVAGLAEPTAPVDEVSDQIQAMLATTTGQLIVAGERGSGAGACCLLIARVDTHGQLAAPINAREFNLGGTQLSPFFEMRAALAQDDAGLWLARTSFPNEGNHRTRFTLIRLLPDGTLDTAYNGRGWRDFFILDPVTHTARGDYIQLHDTVWDGDRVVLFGRVFFEDDGTPDDYVSLLALERAAEFRDGFESLTR